MSDESILPFLSRFDPALQSEGSLDPLGLFAIADALGVQLAPGVRERQSAPRYLTLALVGMAACPDKLKLAGEYKGLPAWLVYEWLIVDSLVRQYRGTPQLRGIPGRDKVQATIAQNDVVCLRTYLKSPSVFGFHGVYRVLGVKAGIFDTEGHPLEQGYRVLSAWQEDQKLAGFVDGSGPGSEFRREIERAIRSGLELEQMREASKPLRELIGAHLYPHETGAREQNALWMAITHNNALRGELAQLLTTKQGQKAWDKARGDERTFHNWLESRASLPMQQILKAIRTFERLARLLTDAFDELRWRMTLEHGTVRTPALGAGPAMQIASAESQKALEDALTELGEVNPIMRSRAEHILAWIGETKSPSLFAVQLIAHHARVQNAKPPNGKRSWIDAFNDGRYAIRPGYTVDEFTMQPGRYVHAFRTNPLWSFAIALDRGSLGQGST